MLVPIIIAMCFLPADKSIKIGSLDFQALRIIALVSLLKILSSPPQNKLIYNTIDKLFISYNLFGSIIYIISSTYTFNAFLYKGGVFIDSILLYIVFKHCIQSKETMLLICKTFSLCIIVLLPFAFFEFFTATNLFAFLGRSSIAFRDGEVRVACTFSHSILFGSFAAALFPVLWAYYMIKKSFLKLIPLIGCIFIIYACSSSGPIIACAAGVCFLSFFKWKQQSNLLSKLIFLISIFIHFAREKPIWHFIYVRISIKGSSTGWHRYILTEAAVDEFWSWWLLGFGDRDPGWHLKYWPRTHAKFTDITNHYILEGVRGGFFTMIIFVTLCYKTIKTLGTISILEETKEDQWLWWGFTVMMIVHCVTFLSVAYFGQITMLLYLNIAVASYAFDKLQKTNSVHG